MRDMKYKLFYYPLFLIIVLLQQSCSKNKTENNVNKFIAVESTISTLHQALKNKTANCVSITNTFLKRIKKYDQSKKLNAIILINPAALLKAQALDNEYDKTQKLRSLHCVPVILKDNFDTADMPTEAGAIALKGSMPSDDAFMVKKLRDAGAIILAKSNMAEWAFSQHYTISSTHGETRNAYDINRVPAGSSGGTASAIAASFGVIGMGTDTGNSIRGPASHLALVGMRSTFGLTSRDGIIPLVRNRDIAGPLTRTVEDAAKTFNIIAGYDSADPVTHNKLSKIKTDYTQYLKKSGLKGVRIAVLRQLFDTDVITADFEVLDLMDQAINDLKSAGAIIVDPFEINNFESLRMTTGFCSRFRYDLNHYLSSLGKNAPLKKFQDIVDKKLFSRRSEQAMEWAASVKVNPQDQNPPCIDVQGDPRRKGLLTAVLNAMDRHNIDVIIYPTWRYPPRIIDDNESAHGNNSSIIAPHTGQPSITVPMGFTSNGLPAGLQFLARPFDDAKLFQYAYAYEQFTQHRKPPVLFP